MRNSRSAFAAIAAASGAISFGGAALAGQTTVKSEAYEISNARGMITEDRARTIAVADFIGRVEIAVHDGPMTAMVYDGQAEFPVTVTTKGDVLYVKGPKPLDMNAINKKMWRGNRGDYEDRLDKFIADYPTLKVLAPRGAGVKVVDSVAAARGGDIGGFLYIDGGYVNAEFGDLMSVEADIDGAGDILVGEIAKKVALSINGSGDFSGVSAGSALIKVNGSGDVELGKIASGAELMIYGSGDIDLADVGGPLKLAIAGSGDIQAGRVNGGLDVTINGSGDVGVLSVDGPTKASISGNGDINIAGGRASDLTVEIRGSGDFSLAGVSTNLTALVGGGGVVSVERNEGSLTATGDGDVYVGGVQKLKKKHY
ncbi:MAG: hypothetical protein GC152_15685 [Alphaproteobacteria bacterium]|nr:hypothetical protein [Alphaproteobacteria bacterium]